VIISGLTLPLVMAFYGWVADLQLPVPILILAITLFGAVEILGFLPLTAFVVDAFGVYSASAMTALIVTRCLMGTFLPLAMDPLIRALGYGWAFSVLGVAGLVLAPIPPVLFRYGWKWRQVSTYTKAE
jgi:hypothetical protein